MSKQMVWQPIKMLAHEYPNRNYGIVYGERDDGKRQLRYYIDKGGEECEETIINLPEGTALCEQVEVDDTASVPSDEVREGLRLACEYTLDDLRQLRIQAINGQEFNRQVASVRGALAWLNGKGGEANGDISE